MELDLPYSISNHQGELYIMYRHKLGEGVNGRVKLAQNLTTGKVLAAKIQQEIAGEKDYAKQAEIEMENNIAQLLNIHSATIQRNTYSVTKQDLPVTKVKNTIFLDFVEGDTLGNYLSKEIAKFKKAATSKPKKFIPSNTSNSSQDELSFQKNILQALLVSLQALKSLSEKGVVHTDLHFDNIMYLNDPTRQDASSATIIDFGNSVLIDHKKKKATLDNTHIIKRVVLSWRHEGMRLPGIKKRLAEQHPHYAPELITNNEVDSRVDIYSFGQGIKRIVDVFENNKVPVSEAFIKQLKDIYTPMIKQNPNLRKNIDFHIRKCELLIKNIMNSDAPKQKATDPLPPVRNSRRGRRM